MCCPLSVSPACTGAGWAGGGRLAAELQVAGALSPVPGASRALQSGVLAEVQMGYWGQGSSLPCGTFAS